MSYQGFLLLLLTVNVVLIQSQTISSNRLSEQPLDAYQPPQTWLETLRDGVIEGVNDLAPLLNVGGRVSKIAGLVQGVSNLLGVDNTKNNIVEGLLQTAVSAVSGRQRYPHRIIRDAPDNAETMSRNEIKDLSDSS